MVRPVHPAAPTLVNDLIWYFHDCKRSPSPSPSSRDFVAKAATYISENQHLYGWNVAMGYTHLSLECIVVSQQHSGLTDTSRYEYVFLGIETMVASSWAGLRVTV